MTELVVLAHALNISPMLLLYPSFPDCMVEYLPGQTITSRASMDRFSGQVLSRLPWRIAEAVRLMQEELSAQSVAAVTGQRFVSTGEAARIARSSAAQI
ncbi:hypothetical protein [Nocardia sp.]|uniref:hypothetical protein n=1 Tax=Nocardia sp. TaxID=1821 RepID=UPI0026212E74|nr:hypothetical protein [Nocardia sp.]